jgi:hypothetical protein
VETTAAEQRVADSLATHPAIVAARSFVNATEPRNLSFHLDQLVLHVEQCLH